MIYASKLPRSTINRLDNSRSVFSADDTASAIGRRESKFIMDLDRYGKNVAKTAAAQLHAGLDDHTNAGRPKYYILIT